MAPAAPVTGWGELPYMNFLIYIVLECEMSDFRENRVFEVFFTIYVVLDA